jgi:membrane protein
MNFRLTLWLVRRALSSALDDNCFNIAKGAAFSATLSLFPGLVFLAAILFRGNAAAALNDIYDLLGHVLTNNVHELLAVYLAVPPGRSTWLILGTGLTAVVFAAEAMISLMEGFRAAYRLPRSWSGSREHAIAFGLVFVTAIPVAFASTAMIFGYQIEIRLVEQFGHPLWAAAAVRLAGWSIALITVVLVLGCLYYLAPHREQRWRDVLPGATFAALLWWPSTLLFAFYVQNLAYYGDLYGSVAAFVVVLIWMYLLSSIVLIGCEFNAERERLIAAMALEATAARSGLGRAAGPASGAAESEAETAQAGSAKR